MDQETKEIGGKNEMKVKKFRLYKFVALLFLVIFLLGGLVIFENDITVENIRYLIKYLDFSSSGDYNEDTVIRYNADPSNRFLVFRGDLAIVNGSGLTLYDRRGSAVMTDTYSMTTPTAVCSERYLVVYDLGGHQVKVYNSFSLLFEKKFDYVVQSVSVNSDGAFCVVTSEKSYHSAVFVYDKNFKEVHKWLSSDKFAYDAHLSDKNILSVLAIRVLDGDLCGDLIALKLGKKDSLYTYTYREQMPLSIWANRNHTFLLTDERLICLEEGQELRSASFPQNSLKQIRYGDKMSAIVQNELSVGVNFKVRVFDQEANEISSQKFSTQIRDIEIWDDTVYILTHTSLFSWKSGEEIKETPLEGDFSDLGVLSKNTLVLCSDNQAKIFVVK